MLVHQNNTTSTERDKDIEILKHRHTLAEYKRNTNNPCTKELSPSPIFNESFVDDNFGPYLGTMSNLGKTSRNS